MSIIVLYLAGLLVCAGCNRTVTPRHEFPWPLVAAWPTPMLIWLGDVLGLCISYLRNITIRSARE